VINLTIFHHIDGSSFIWSVSLGV